MTKQLSATEIIESEWNSPDGPAKGKPYRRTSKLYRSVASIKLDVSDSANGIYYLSVPKESSVTLFDYGLGEQIDDGFGGERKASAADTNLAKGGFTNGGEDFAIEAMSLTSLGFRLAVAPFAAPGNKTVADAYAGLATLVDPVSFIVPPQLASPFNLEDAVFARLVKQTAVTFVWDQGQSTLPIGALDEIPEGGASSFLRANGEPHPSSRMRIPEGYQWRHAGEGNSQFQVKLVVSRGLVVPCTAITLPGASAISVPTGVCLDIAMRAHGTAFSPLQKNG